MSREFMSLQRVPRGLWQGASRREWWAPLPRGATRPQAAILVRGVSPSHFPGRALREIAPRAGAFSRGARGETPRMQTALRPLRICRIFPAVHALH